MRKKDYVSSDKVFSTDRLEVPQGKMTVGTGRDYNSVLKNIVVGSAYTQGNQVRSLFDLNGNGVLSYNPTEEDDVDQIRRNGTVFTTYPTLIDYPFLTVPSFNPDTVINNSQQFPIFNVPGKGLGNNIEWWTSATRINGVEDEGVQENVLFYEQQIDNVVDVLPRTINNPIFPFSGKNYSGVIVQLQVEKNDETKVYKNMKIIPYQTGRGIPQYDPTQMYFSGNPYGTPTWPDSSNPIPPQLSMGAVPGNNNSPLGVIIDTYKVSQENVIYRYNTPDDVLNQDWLNHSAPFSIPSSTTTGFSARNSVGSYAPWSSDYAYVANDPVPVLTRGQTSIRIGAGYNIGMQAYYEPDIEEGDDPLTDSGYVSVPVVPLFQGEELRVGSFVYACAQGHVITPDKLAVSCYPVPVYRDRLNDSYNPWYDWSDITYGATGWTSTPQFQLQGIPDEGVAIIETKDGETLPYLSQANQGTLIVQPVTTVNPASSQGSGRMVLISPASYEQSNNCVFTNITKFPGAPDRAQPAGTSMECIKGTGQWEYTGGATLSATQTVIAPGTGYTDQFNVDTYNSSKNNLVLSVDVVNGVITSVDDVGSGSTVTSFDDYPVGTQLSIISTIGGISFDTNARIEVTSNDGTTVMTFSITTGGTGFTDGTGIMVNTQNLIWENPTVDIVTSSGGVTSVKIRDTGINNITGDTILIDDTNFTSSFTIDTTIDSYGFRQIKGGYGYEIGTTIDPELLDASGSALYDVTIFETRDQSFSLTKFFQSTGGITLVDEFVHIRQNTHQDITVTGPGGVPAPGGGWDSYLFTQSAQMVQQKPVETSLISGGTGYSTGSFTATNGTSVVDLDVFAVDSIGSVTSLTLYIDAPSGTEIGSTIYTISGGGFNATFSIGVPLQSQFNTGFITGGTGYTTSTGVATRNLSTNSLFVLGQVDVPGAGNCTAYGYDPAGPTATDIVMPVKNSADGGFTYIDLSRYSVADVITFEQSPGVTGTFSITSIDVATSELTISQSDFGTGFVTPPSSDYAFFPTTNTSEVITTVDITTNTDGKIVGLSINTLGDRIRYGDFLLVEGGNENFVFQFTPEMNVPPAWQPFINLRPATATEWNDYKTMMTNSVNLLTKNLITNFTPMYPNYFNNSYYFNGDGGFTFISES